MPGPEVTCLGLLGLKPYLNLFLNDKQVNFGLAGWPVKPGSAGGQPGPAA
jgi:hypothetical protein